MIKPVTIRIALCLATSKQWPIWQLDIYNAVPHDNLSEEVYMKQPSGFVDSRFPLHMCKLWKSLYGLKQWFAQLSAFLLSQGFQA